MKSFATILVASGTLISLTAAQTYNPVNPDDIDINRRDLWCIDQLQACPALCQDQEQVPAVLNECDAETLEYTCLCENNKSPNMTEYSMTIDYHLCQQSITNCVVDCEGEAICSDLCFTGKQCGATDPTRHNATTTSGSPTPSKTAGSDDDDDDDDEDGDNKENPFAEDSEGLAARSAAALGLGVIATVAGMGFLGLL